MNRRNFISEYTRVNRTFENAYSPKVKRALHVKVKAVISDLQSGGYQHAIAGLHTDVGNAALQSVISDLYREVGLRHARLNHRRLVAEQKKGLGFNEVWTKFVQDYLARFLLQKITFEVSHTTRNALLKVLSQGVEEGMGIDQMVSLLKEWPFERYQAARIVRTEVNRAANVGATAQESTAEYEQQKIWIAVNDNRTRGKKPGEHANHVALNGTTIDKGDVFVDPINGDQLEFPGDPKASAASTINCRCSVAYVNKRDANGELVPKRKTTAVIYPRQRNRGQMVTI